MVCGYLAHKASRFTILMQIFKNSSCFIPVAIVHVINKNMHMLYVVSHSYKQVISGSFIPKVPLIIFLCPFKPFLINRVFQMKDVIQMISLSLFEPVTHAHLIVASSMDKLLKIFPVEPSQLSHMPHICFSIYRKCLLLLLFQGLLVSSVRIIPIIKFSLMGLDQNCVPTGIV